MTELSCQALAQRQVSRGSVGLLQRHTAHPQPHRPLLLLLRLKATRRHRLPEDSRALRATPCSAALMAVAVPIALVTSSAVQEGQGPTHAPPQAQTGCVAALLRRSSIARVQEVPNHPHPPVLLQVLLLPLRSRPSHRLLLLLLRLKATRRHPHPPVLLPLRSRPSHRPLLLLLRLEATRRHRLPEDSRALWATPCSAALMGVAVPTALVASSAVQEPQGPTHAPPQAPTRCVAAPLRRSSIARVQEVLNHPHPPVPL